MVRTVLLYIIFVVLLSNEEISSKNDLVVYLPSVQMKPIHSATVLFCLLRGNVMHFLTIANRKEQFLKNLQSSSLVTNLQEK